MIAQKKSIPCLGTPTYHECALTRGSGNGALSGLPVWARIVGLVGLPGVISLFLVYYLTTAIAEGVRANEQALNRLATGMERCLAEPRTLGRPEK